VTGDFAPTSLDRALNRLTATNIGRINAGLEKAAHVYTAENYAEKLREVVTSVLKEF
jgi:hypothetical protein